VNEKYAFINAEKANYPIIKGCRWLSVSRAGFYAWLAAPATAAARHRVTLAGLIAEVFAHSRQTYGARRIAASLRASGYPNTLNLGTG